MNKNTIFPNLLQRIVLEEELAGIQGSIGYQDTARKLNVLTLIKYLIFASMNEWKSYRHLIRAINMDCRRLIINTRVFTLYKKRGRYRFETTEVQVNRKAHSHPY
ncbi:hypothetical protein [Halalkalibacterium ligniniphilum]|uniref:hypothetical protein n=1 Tax=Halalkalibacterium ligniniphilum TaxID=1134413 RepID=UPI000382C8BA|nr:hypothetical protein [Halalkalibacterium ligniniphilum]